MKPPPPDNETYEALEMGWRAMLPILYADDVWLQEIAREGAVPLPWPWLPTPGHEKGTEALLRWLAEGTVDALLADFAASHEVHIDADANSPAFQVVLRVVKRAIRLAERRIVSSHAKPRGGAYILAGGRDLNNWIKKRMVDNAYRSGRPVGESLAKLPFSRAAAYRAPKRK